MKGIGHNQKPETDAKGTVGALSLSQSTGSEFLSNFPLSLTQLKTSFSTKYPFSCGAKKKVCVNFIFTSAPLKEPVTTTMIPE